MIILPKANWLCAQNPPGMVWCPPDFNNPNNIVLWFETMNIGGLVQENRTSKEKCDDQIIIPKYPQICQNHHQPLSIIVDPHFPDDHRIG